MELNIAVLPGDGIGPEVTRAAVRVLGAVADRFGHRVRATEGVVGWTAIEAHDDPLPADTLRACLTADAVLLGAVGAPAHASSDGPTAEAGLLALRGALGCFANLRPVRVPDAFLGCSPLRPAAARGTDLLIVRELAGGLYYGPAGRESEPPTAWNTMVYSASEIERIAHVAFQRARRRRHDVVSVDKANVLDVSRLWRQTVDAVGRQYPDVTLRHMLVDRAAMELVIRPSSFDVLLTENLFGDILSDLAGAVPGSLGVLGSASLGGRVDLYEPVHGSAPDIAGRGLANPMGAIYAVALMLRETFGLEREAAVVETAVEHVLARGLRTRDLAGDGTPWVGTDDFAAAVAEDSRSAARKGADVTATGDVNRA